MGKKKLKGIVKEAQGRSKKVTASRRNELYQNEKRKDRVGWGERKSVI